MNKKISVLIANYNNQKYIHECIKSLTDQTYDNLEIIVFDDCSSDESILEINKFKKVKLIPYNKRGKFGAFNQMHAYREAFKKSKMVDFLQIMVTHNFVVGSWEMFGKIIFPIF